MAVVVTAVFHPAPGHRDDLIAALVATIPGVHAETGCELYSIHDADDDTITMIEKWTTVEDLDAHGSGEAVAALAAATAPFMAEPTTVHRMFPIPAGTDAQGLL